MRSIVIANQKGGVAKTTTAVSIAGLLSDQNQVLLIDADPQGSVTEYFQVTHAHTLLDLFSHRQIELFKLAPNLTFIPAHPKLAVIDRYAVESGMVLVLKEYLNSLKKIPYVIIDTSPALGALMVNCLACATDIIIPTACDPLSIASMHKMLKTITLMRSKLNEGFNLYILPVMVDTRMNLTKDYLNYLSSQFSQQVLPPIPLDSKLKQASFLHMFPHKNTPSSKAVLAYKDIVQNVIIKEHSNDRFIRENQ